MRRDVVPPPGWEQEPPLGQEEQPERDGDCARHVKYEEGVTIGMVLVTLALIARIYSRQERRA
jgi:hypothetical protein